MQKLKIATLLLFLSSCGGSVSDEQRKQMSEARKEQAIVKVTDAELMDMTFSKGRAILEVVQKSPTGKIDSIAQGHSVKINWIEPGGEHARLIEKQIIDAYIESVIIGEPQQDNVQRIGSDSLLYTKAVVEPRADGSVEIKGTWNIWFSKKQLVLSLTKK